VALGALRSAVDDELAHSRAAPRARRRAHPRLQRALRALG
jgi:hypothetical protein